MSRSKHFCCCIPVRFGVFIMSLGEAILTGLIAALLFFAVHSAEAGTTFNNGQKITLTHNQEIGAIVVGVVFAITCLISVFGFIGSITRNRKFVKTYSILVWGALLINTVAGVAWVIAAAKTNTDTLISDCQSEAQNDQDKNSCNDFFSHKKTAIIIVSCILGVQLLWQLYGCVIVARYVDQLSDEQAFAAYTREPAFNSTAGPKAYYPHEAVNQSTELLNAPPGGYPYADPHHAFGADKHDGPYNPPQYA